jgi:integrase
MNLTDAAVRKFKASKARREIRDGQCAGLYLVIEPTGHKSWALRFRRPNGKSAKLHLGTVDFSGFEAKDAPVRGTPLTLAGARALAAEVHRQRRRDRERDVVADYAAEKRRRHATREASAKSTFAAAARDFVEEYARKKQRRWPETARLLGLDPKKELAIIRGSLVDRWVDNPIAKIDGHDIFGVVEETRRSGAPGLERRNDGPTESRARAMLSCLSTMFGWLVQKRRVEKNPCAGLHREAPEARDRVLTDAEIAVFWRACGEVSEPFGRVLRLLLLTGCRLNEVAGMRREELSQDGATWDIPGTRTKNRRPHTVPLPSMARDILATVKPIVGKAGLIFTTTGKTPVSGWSKTKHRLDAAMKIPSWRLHDLRRTFVTGLADLGIRPDVIELTVNHVSGMRGGIAGVYNRSELLTERRAALARWGQHIAGLVSGEPANVVSLAGRKP